MPQSRLLCLFNCGWSRWLAHDISADHLWLPSPVRRLERSASLQITKTAFRKGGQKTFKPSPPAMISAQFPTVVVCQDCTLNRTVLQPKWSEFDSSDELRKNILVERFAVEEIKSRTIRTSRGLLGGWIFCSKASGQKCFCFTSLSLPTSCSSLPLERSDDCSIWWKTFVH